MQFGRTPEAQAHHRQSYPNRVPAAHRFAPSCKAQHSDPAAHHRSLSPHVCGQPRSLVVLPESRFASRLGPDEGCAKPPPLSAGSDPLQEHLPVAQPWRRGRLALRRARRAQAASNLATRWTGGRHGQQGGCIQSHSEPCIWPSSFAMPAGSAPSGPQWCAIEKTREKCTGTDLVKIYSPFNPARCLPERCASGPSPRAHPTPCQ